MLCSARPAGEQAREYWQVGSKKGVAFGIETGSGKSGYSDAIGICLGSGRVQTLLFLPRSVHQFCVLSCCVSLPPAPPSVLPPASGTSAARSGDQGVSAAAACQCVHAICNTAALCTLHAALCSPGVGQAGSGTPAAAFTCTWRRGAGWRAAGQAAQGPGTTQPRLRCRSLLPWPRPARVPHSTDPSWRSTRWSSRW